MHDPVSELAIDLCAPLDRAFEQFRAEVNWAIRNSKGESPPRP
jgi:hypothetical protein